MLKLPKSINLHSVIFDLDDTIYDHRSYVKGAYLDISSEVSKIENINPKLFFESIWSKFKSRTSKDNCIFSDALKEYKIYTKKLEEHLVETYRKHNPDITCHPDIEHKILELKKLGIKIGLLTDGHPEVQKRKILSLNIENIFDEIVFTGKLGRKYYKPHKLGYELILNKMDTLASETIFIGDDPDTDIIGAVGVGILPIRVVRGQYSNKSNQKKLKYEFSTTAEAVSFILRSLKN